LHLLHTLFWGCTIARHGYISWMKRTPRYSLQRLKKPWFRVEMAIFMPFVLCCWKSTALWWICCNVCFVYVPDWVIFVFLYFPLTFSRVIIVNKCSACYGHMCSVELFSSSVYIGWQVSPFCCHYVSHFELSSSCLTMSGCTWWLYLSYNLWCHIFQERTTDCLVLGTLRFVQHL